MTKSIPGVTMALLTLILITVSCKKKDTNNNTTTTTTTSAKDMVTGAWKMSKTATDANNNNQPDEAEKQDLDAGEERNFVFKNDGTGTSYSKYNSVADTSLMTWTLINNDKTLLLVEDSDSMFCSIYALTNSDMIIEASDNDPGMPKDWFILKKQ